MRSRLFLAINETAPIVEKAATIEKTYNAPSSDDVATGSVGVGVNDALGFGVDDGEGADGDEGLGVGEGFGVDVLGVGKGVGLDVGCGVGGVMLIGTIDSNMAMKSARHFGK
jgi:hypothetical protein